MKLTRFISPSFVGTVAGVAVGALFGSGAGTTAADTVTRWWRDNST